MTRMETLALDGRITEELVSEEIGRLQIAWSGFLPTVAVDDGLSAVLSDKALAELDLFDRLQLVEVVRVCQASRSLAEAGRVLFNQSRQQKTSVNDSHRLKQYLQKLGLVFQLSKSQLFELFKRVYQTFCTSVEQTIMHLSSAPALASQSLPKYCVKLK
jgi:transcriptional regulatory protein RtcR